MKSIPSWVACLGLATVFSFATNATAQGAAFTYQGHFVENGVPFTGTAEFTFTLWDASIGGSQLAASTPASLLAAVTNGLFTTSVDFGAAPFAGAERWLQIEVRTTLGFFTTLTPRQAVTPTPYALRALSVQPGGLASGYYTNAVALSNAANQFYGTFTGNGDGLIRLNASELTTGTVPDVRIGTNIARANQVWRLNGNSGTTPGTQFLGTTDNQPLEIKVNGLPILRLEPDANGPNIIGGYYGNSVSAGVIGATIAGGGSPLGLLNKVTGNGGVIGGGVANQAGGAAVVGGGSMNSATNDYAVVAGGRGNRTEGTYAAIPGGDNNTATNYSLAAGRRAKAVHSGTFVWADSTDSNFFSATSNQFRVRAGGGLEVVGGNSVETFKFSGSRSGDFASPVAYGENNNISGSSGPTLRLVGKGGNSVDGVLSVSSLGTGDLAAFGNSSAFVSRLTTNGTWTALAYNPNSDRHAKENFAPIDSRAILDKVAALPLTRWNYKAAPGLEHVGPMAQDFHGAFGLNGADDRHIATVDADGVALAAIQGLNQKMEAENAALRSDLRARSAEIQALKDAVAELQSALKIPPPAR